MQTEQNLRLAVAGCLNIIKEFDWLLNSYVLDFFVHDHWNKLPASWRKTFDNVDVSEVADLLQNEKPQRILPLSLLALLVAVNKYSIPRKPSEALLKDGNIFQTHRKCDKPESPSKNELSSILSSKQSKLNNIFSKRIKKKKRHEISLMSEVVNKTAECTDCYAVTDIGSGLGHLIRTLAYKHNMQTIGIEAQHDLVIGARKLDDQLNETVTKYLNDKIILENMKPNHIHTKLTIDDRHTIINNLNKQFKKSYGLIGLHPCGDLSPLLLKMFNENSEVKFLCIVGCCYMKLSCGDSDFVGYPLSRFVSNVKEHSLTYEARELSCHAIESYCYRLKKGLYQDLQIHCFRALLEKIIVSKWPHKIHLGLRSVKHYDTLTFEKYCEIAVDRLGIDLDKDDICSDQNNILLQDWKKVVIFYSLRLILAPLVESVILFDRILYLKENGITSEIMAVFDPMISPRNHILIARKS